MRGDDVPRGRRDATVPPVSPRGATRVPGARHPGAGDATVEDAPTSMTDAAPFDAPPFIDGETFDTGEQPDVSSQPSYDASAYGAWQVVAAPPFVATGSLLLTDGTVMVNDSQQSSKWWRLTPDQTGSYVNGTWSATAEMPSGYEPIFFSSAVLADGRVLVIGGEYDDGAMVETSLGALYDPTLDLWTPVAAPNPLNTWYEVGDAPNVVLANGTLMLGNIGGEQDAFFDERTLTWTNLGAPGYGDAGIGKDDDNAEEGWTLLPNGKVLTVDVGVGLMSGTTKNSELFDPATLTWSSAGSTGVQLSVGYPTSGGYGYEVGPQVLLPNGSVLAIGATGNTAVYGADGGWTPGPTFPNSAAGQFDIADGPAALLPNGNVLCVASPGFYQQQAEFFEYDGTKLTQVAATQNAVNDSSFNIFLLLLPTGQVLSVDDSQDVEIYTPTGSPSSAWAPTITTAPTTVVRGTTYRLEGTQFNGLSQAVAYGDDYQAATNYPLVRITNNSTGHVFYGRTHDHSTMGVATGSATVSTNFEAPAGAETGMSSLVVVANGIPSAPVTVTIQ